MKKEEEVWLDVVGYEGLYEVSSWGRVKSFPRRYTKHKKEIILSNSINKQGYLNIKLCKESIQKEFKAHRLVAQAFIPNPNNYPLVMHKDDNPSNNYYKNLQWGTNKMNTDDMNNKNRGVYNSGEKVHLSKLTDKDVLEIRAKYTGKHGEKSKLGKEYNVAKSTIERIVNRKTWKHI